LYTNGTPFFLKDLCRGNFVVFGLELNESQTYNLKTSPFVNGKVKVHQMAEQKYTTVDVKIGANN
jgi:hypothetical protein